MLTFKEFMMSESGGGWGVSARSGGGSQPLSRGMLHNRQAASRMYSPAPPIGGDFGSWFHHHQANIANVLEFLYHRYEAKDLVIVNGKPCMAASEMEHWHESIIEYLVNNGALVKMPAQTLWVRQIERALSDSLPSFEHHAAGPKGKSESHFYTTEETLANFGDPAEVQDWIATQRISAKMQLPGLVFFAVNTTKIIMLRQRQGDIHSAINLGRQVIGHAVGQGTYQADPHTHIFKQ